MSASGIDISEAVVTQCPACNSDQYEAPSRSAREFLCNGDTSLRHPAYNVYCCAVCALHYKSHVLTATALETYYASLEYTPFDVDFGFPTDEAIYARLRHLTWGSRVLDFGCSTGRILRRLGSHYERFGVEINAAAAAEAARSGITIVTEAEVAAGKAGKFDAIMLTDVFEHLFTPTETIQMLTEQLAPGGELLIVTGMADAVKPLELIAEHWYFRIPGHLQMLSRAHIYWLAGTLGLDVTNLHTMSHYKFKLLRRLKQEAQAALYTSLHLAPTSPIADIIRLTPGIGRATRWTNLPSTDQKADHVFVTLRKSKVD